jgi:hypothetical protein
MPTASLDDLLLYFCDSPMMGSTVGGWTRNAYPWSNSRRQLIYRIACGLAEVTQFLSIHSPFKGSTDIGAG